jgi:hypothetical protein
MVRWINTALLFCEKIHLIINDDVDKIMQDIIRIFKFIFPEEDFPE